MRTYTFRFLVWLLALSIPIAARATHQVGGQLEMRAVGDVPGHYRIIVTNYLEAGARADAQGGGTLGVFRKRDDALMTTFDVVETGKRQPLVFSNEFCASLRNLNFIVVTFEANVQLNPANYADTQGYYISYQTRNRNAGINNISNPVQTGYTFYLEFPALQQNGKFFSNSSPQFAPINGEYICLGEPFTFPFGATDPDGDELRYSFVTPLNQKGTAMGGIQNVVSAAPYPDVVWLPGFAASNSIPGSPPLSIDSQTGQLSITATQLGLFVFAVKVEEYRNGTKIGEVRRDFQFLVIDCPPNTTPDPSVQIKNQPAGQREATICPGDSAVIQAAINPNWNYQWRRNGINLSHATGAMLAVHEAGEYTVVVSQKTACSKAGNSQTVTINMAGVAGKLSAVGHLCATSGSVRMLITSTEPATYQWYRNGQIVPNQTTDSLPANQEGRYWAVLTQQPLGCVSRTDTVSLVRSVAVQAALQSATGSHRLCPKDSLQLTGSGGVSYTWQRDGQVIAGATGANYRANMAGTYSLTAIDADGCTSASASFVVEQIPPVMVTLDSVPAVCGTNVPIITLKGSPPGGEYAGAGVSEADFSPGQAGIGNHVLTYTVKSAPECTGTVASRTAVVAPIPTIDMPDTLITYKGNTLPLTPELTGNPISFRWTPPTYLDNPASANPSVVNIAGDITYVLAVANSAGCRAQDTVHITVYERIWTPDAFTPNGDGLNDVWVLPGIEAFPDAVITIFNRWGEVVYFSGHGYAKPFDGTLNGSALPTGVYPYSLHPAPTRPTIQGQLMLLRE